MFKTLLSLTFMLAATWLASAQPQRPPRSAPPTGWRPFVGTGFRGYRPLLPFYYYAPPWFYEYHTMWQAPQQPSLPPDHGHALVHILAPKTAKVWFNDEPCEHAETRRMFLSPPLPRGSANSYTVKAQWTEEGRLVKKEKEITLRVQDEVVVNFLDDKEFDKLWQHHVMEGPPKFLAKINEHQAIVDVAAPPMAKVWVGDVLCEHVGGHRMFMSPPLETGKKYTYMVRAAWKDKGKEVSREEKVTFQGGEQVIVDFSKKKD